MPFLFIKWSVPDTRISIIQSLCFIKVFFQKKKKHLKRGERKKKLSNEWVAIYLNGKPIGFVTFYHWLCHTYIEYFIILLWHVLLNRRSCELNSKINFYFLLHISYVRNVWIWLLANPTQFVIFGFGLSFTRFTLKFNLFYKSTIGFLCK